MQRLFERLRSFVTRPAARAGFGVSAGIFSSLFFAANALAQAAGAPANPAATTQSPGIVNTILGFLAEMLIHLTSVVNDVMIALLDVVITIMQYNRFTSSPVVSAGWSIVRDAVNMFFVVALIVIAVGTIIGYSKFRWQQQVPRLLIFALVINFSKTLCGLMIDVGQVVMLTFANALRNVAAGNFIQLFTLSLNKLRDTGQPLTDFTLFAGALAGFIASVWVLATVLALVAILAWRIVYLWVLVTIAPLTWFVGGARGVISSHAYEEWWKEFTCMVVIGPILTFFLWLTLVVAGAGNIAVTEFGLNNATNPDVSIQTSIDLLGSSQLLSFIIAMTMMYAGFRAASDFCEGTKGLTSGAIGWAGGFYSKGGAGRRGAAVAGAVGLAAGAGAGRLGLKGAGRVDEKLGISSSRPVLAAQAGLSRVRTAGINAGAALGLGAAGKQQHALHAATDLEDKAKKQEAIGDFAGAAATRATAAEERKHATAFGKETLGGLADLSNEDKAKFLVGLSSKGPLTGVEQQQAQLLFAEAAGDAKGRKALDEAGVLGKMMENAGGKDAIKAAVGGDKDLSTKFGDFLASRPDITGDFGGINDVDALRKIDPKALATIASNPALKDRFEAKIGNIDSGQFDKDTKAPIKLLEYLKSGRTGGRSREAYNSGLAGFYGGMAGEELAKQNFEEVAPHLTAEMLQKPGAEGMSQKLLASNLPAAKATLENPATREAAMKGIGLEGGGVTDPTKLGNFLRSNPGALRNIDTSALTPPAVAAIGNSLGKDQVGSLMTQYKKASDADRAELAGVMDRAQASLDAAGSDLAGKFKAERARFEGQAVAAAPEAASPLAGGEANLARMTEQTGRLTAQTEQLANQVAEANRALAAEAAKPAPDAARQATLSNDLTRLQQQQSELRAERNTLDREMTAVRDQVNELRVARSAAEAQARSEQS